GLRPPRHRQLPPRPAEDPHRPRPLPRAPLFGTRRPRSLNLPARLLAAPPIQAPLGGALHAPREGPVADRPRGREGPAGQARLDRREDELPRGRDPDPGPLPGLRRRSADHARRPRDLLPAAGRAGPVEPDLRMLGRRAVPRAQPLLLLRTRRGGGDLHLPRRLDATPLLP